MASFFSLCLRNDKRLAFNTQLEKFGINGLVLSVLRTKLVSSSLHCLYDRWCGCGVRFVLWAWQPVPVFQPGMQVVSWQKRFQKMFFSTMGRGLLALALRIFISLYCACSTRKFFRYQSVRCALDNSGRLTFSSNLYQQVKLKAACPALLLQNQGVSFVNVDHGKPVLPADGRWPHRPQKFQEMRRARARKCRKNQIVPDQIRWHCPWWLTSLA